MTYKKDPNIEFRKRKRHHNQLLMVGCGRCGHKKLIDRGVWLSDETIVCPDCGETDAWATLHNH